MQDYQNRSKKMNFSLRREKWYYVYMIYFVLLFVEIIILFLLSRSMSRTLSRFMSINLLSFLFLPGIIIHELSHLFVAAILFVSVGNMEFTPKKDGNGVKLGSVEIAKTDPVRRSIIGFAPVFVGFMLVIGIVYLFSANILSSTDSVLDLFFQNKNPYIFIAVILVLAYLLFTVSNTMFSSRADMEGTIEILITFFIIFGAAYILGFRPPLAIFNKILTKEVIGVIQKSTVFLLVPIVIDIFILGIIRVFKK